MDHNTDSAGIEHAMPAAMAAEALQPDGDPAAVHPQRQAMPSAMADEALQLLRQLTGDPLVEFRTGQLEAIEGLVGGRERLLLVQRTGWGKSAVYFIATRMLRDRGAGPTLLVSPLLALMRNQIAAAERMGIRAATINSSNVAEWGLVHSRLAADAVDLLLISPERLGNEKFRSTVLPDVGRRSGLLVVDEAHCVSEWGHDFRPDYRRIARVLEFLPTGVPVLCCTATANERVCDDVGKQLRAGVAAVRGPLPRAGLALHVLRIPAQAQRLHWLTSWIPTVAGTGVIYCLTVADTCRVADWLSEQGIDAVAYSGATDPEQRISIEIALLANEVKVVVATSALGMGFDKPDLSFVVHYQAPGSPIAYYQQVGRAGRALAESWGVLLSGYEDAEIHDYFIRNAFPPPDVTESVVSLLEDRAAPVSRSELLVAVNARATQMDHVLKHLAVDGAVERVGSLWQRTLQPWSFDSERVRAVTAVRRAEQEQIREYICTTDCRMQLLVSHLDDSSPPCGICDNCSGRSLATVAAPSAVARATEHLRRATLTIEPRQQLPGSGSIDAHLRIEPGRALSRWSDGGWGDLVREGKWVNRSFDDDLLEAAADLVRTRWRPDPPPSWVTFVPSMRDPELVGEFARRLAGVLGLPCHDAVVKLRETAPQNTQQNSFLQHANVWQAFGIRTPILPGPVLLVDDVVDSRWTLTAVGAALREAGAGPVYPFALADTAGRSA